MKTELYNVLDKLQLLESDLKQLKVEEEVNVILQNFNQVTKTKIIN